ncbi:MAG: hypothetical protein EXS09_05310 [Gemmataceae bacterium]|nr:hypothetical protein [Gemmataceae bacterium]
MLVRLAFSIASATEPEVLLIDEALGAGDKNFLAKARERMASLMQSARLRVRISHAAYLTLSIPTRVDFVNITSDVEDAIRKSGVREGLVLVWVAGLK